jgi:hypothetical protein
MLLLLSVLLDLPKRNERTYVLHIALATVAGTISQIIVAEGPPSGNWHPHYIPSFLKTFYFQVKHDPA